MARYLRKDHIKRLFLYDVFGRFKYVPMLQRISLLSLVGEVMTTQEESKMLAILLHDITYLSSKNRDKARLPPLEYPMLQLVLWAHLPNDFTNPERKRSVPERKRSVLHRQKVSLPDGRLHPQPRWRQLLRIVWNHHK